MEPKKLYRSRRNRMICGVCGVYPCTLRVAEKNFLL